jgi:DHA1 family tetracycline resistance protein-like MFS transporter
MSASSEALVAAPRRAAVVFIFVTVALDILAMGVIIPVLPKLVASFYGGDLVRTSAVYGWFGTVFMLMQFLWSPLLGALSDRFGRRPIVLLSNLGLGLDYIVMALAQSVPLLFVGRVISGITAASVTTASAYIADVTPAEKRAAAFGMLGAAFGLGFIVGPALGGLLGSIDPRLPFWAAGGLSLLNFLYGVFVLPESLPPEKRGRFEWKRANPIGAFTMLRSHPELAALAIVVFLQNLAHVVYPSTFVLYADYRYHWDERTVGFTLAAVGVLTAVIQGGLIKGIVAALGERRTLLLGLALGSLGTLGYGLAPEGWIFWAVMPLASFWGVAGPAMQSIMSQHVSAQEQGRLQGAIMSLAAVAGILGPNLFTLSFAHFISPAARWQVPGASFLLAALVLAVALAVALRATRAPAAA